MGFLSFFENGLLTMRKEDILNVAPRVLTDRQREEYFERGFLTITDIVSEAWVEKLQSTSQKFLRASTSVKESGDTYDLGPNHTNIKPHVRRLKALVDRDPIFWDFARSIPADIAADLVGPDVKFHSSKLNYKWPGAGELVKWHQDIPAWPHTNYSLVTLGVYLENITEDNGPLVCIPGSHLGPIFSHMDDANQWVGSISSEDLLKVELADGVKTLGGAGTVVAINCRTIHGSGSNESQKVRSLPLYVYSSADAFPWMAQPTPTSKTGHIVRGAAAKLAHLDASYCPVPPDWEKVGYNSIFASQDPTKLEHS